ncbi:lactate utilization protein [Clostridium niameyense]|uniref:lactate utilization protein n=1 Tax=Clostridium niameyense TaxID=1622073 RepID=UPI00067ED652|nr:lactate utilization protein [Clostridium niameyense]
MDKNVKWVREQKVIKTMQSLKENNMNAYLVNDKDELIAQIESIVEKGAKVSCGGSMTLFETGVIDHLKSGRYNFLDRYKDGLTKEDIKNIYRESFFSDAYFVSSNAITEDGEIYNVDGNGNRVAAMLYGPDKVIIIVGINKIVKDIKEAIRRNRTESAPANAKRLNRETPCSKVGYCMDCKSKDRICNEYTLIKRQVNKDRIHVIFLNEDLGY